MKIAYRKNSSHTVKMLTDISVLVMEVVPTYVRKWPIKWPLFTVKYFFLSCPYFGELLQILSNLVIESSTTSILTTCSSMEHQQYIFATTHSRIYTWFHLKYNEIKRNKTKGWIWINQNWNQMNLELKEKSEIYWWKVNGRSHIVDSKLVTKAVTNIDEAKILREDFP